MRKIMKAAIVTQAKAPIKIEQRPVPVPRTGEVLIRVTACGLCYGDLCLQQGAFPYTDIAKYPVIPGHEVAGIVAAVGEGVLWPIVGARVGMPWLFSSCGHCDLCLAGGGTMCSEAQVTGVTKDGGFAEYMVAPSSHISLIPEGIDLAEAAPLMCAGLTVYRGLLNADFEPGEKVAVIGMGGLGHLAIQYAKAMGGRVAVISRSAAKEKRARAMGAELFIDGSQADFVEKLQAWDGGADVILATAPSVKEMSASFPGLTRKGRLVVLGLAEEEIKIKPMDIIIGERKLVGSLIGTRSDIQDCLSFSIAHGIRAEIEKFKLEETEKALEALKSGRLKGRAVVVMS
jgi:alcohol dehydrogenase, propanol-preferring